MSRKRIQIRNLTAKFASLFLAVVIWFLIKDLLENQRQSGKSIETPDILGPAINPDLQEKPSGDIKETPTVH